MSKQLTQKTIPHLAWVLLAIATFFYAFQNLIRVSPSVMMPHIMRDFAINAADFGQFSGAYYLGYALMHIPFGLAFDRFKLRYVLSFAIILSVIGIIPMAMNGPWYSVVAGRFLVGAGSSGAILSLFKVFRDHFPSDWFSRLLGGAATIGVLGSVYGSRPIDMLQNDIGYARILWGLIIIGIVLGFVALLLAAKSTTAVQKHDSISDELISVLKNKKIMLTSIFAGFMVGPLEGFADVWALPFLETVYGFDRASAASLPSLVYIGFSIGCPLVAVLGERFKAYYGLIIASGWLMILSFLAMFIFKPTPFMVGALFLCVGIFSGYQVLTMTLNVQNAKPEHAGLVTAITNMIVMSFGSFFHTSISVVMQQLWNGATAENGMPIYSETAYIYGISVIPIALILGVVGFYGLCRKMGRRTK